MGRLDIFEGAQPQPEAPKAGVEWFATVRCQTCGEEVEEQMLYPNESLLVWRCSLGHKSFIEGYNIF